MDAKVGDKIAIDGKKVGQPQRGGRVTAVTKGLSGIRYQVRWDDGTETSFSPKGGNLTIVRRGGGAKKTKTKAKPKPRAKARARATAKRQPKARAKAGTKAKAKATRKPKAKPKTRIR